MNIVAGNTLLSRWSSHLLYIQRRHLTHTHIHVHTQSKHPLYLLLSYTGVIYSYSLRDIWRENALPDGCFFHAFKHTHTHWQIYYVVMRSIHNLLNMHIPQTHTHTPSCPFHSIFLFNCNISQTINSTLAAFYPSSRGHNYIKYTIALCDILSFLMNVSPRSPLAAQSTSFGT